MIDISEIKYPSLDRPEVCAYLFHPRAESDVIWQGSGPEPEATLEIPVEENVVIGGRFYKGGNTSPTLLFFHGNGEIVADYHDIAPEYTKRGLNFLPVDYRGYGRSTGTPTVSAMMRDCHVIFDFAQKWLEERGYTGPLILMGRSLGSASALELAFHYPDRIAALIIESGFACAGPLLQLLGVNIRAIGFEEKKGFRNADKIRRFEGPTLIIHAEQDHIIPVSDGETLYHASQSPDRHLLKIPGANHNDLLYVGFSAYMTAVEMIADKVIRKESET
ncbi:alpha/beta hydrolase [Desulfonema ishimotonii]|uniref:Alpha/beta hydrolase n=1 Tax=Desulfonema ishimotonii TaxID=45657 RepID=A0A401FT43_9BACT|nr:alpha/beta fold hydrolase [Desulfonema ishimotonii]GBC60142.1 alpha/beta hydrolase [Desulfonema ishimotonii]